MTPHRTQLATAAVDHAHLMQQQPALHAHLGCGTLYTNLTAIGALMLSQHTAGYKLTSALQHG